jgi:kumamolisin
MRIPRLAAPVAACVVVSLALALPAGATPGLTSNGSAATATPSGPMQQVLLGLTPTDRGALQALAHGGSRASSRHGAAPAAALRQALPSPARRQSVADVARSLGLTVERTTTMTVLVRGPASLVRALFGSARAVNPHSPVQQALPRLPADLRGQVTVALGGDDDRPAFRHYALNDDGTPDGRDFRAAYGDTATDPLAPPTPAQRAETIATVQLSGWHPGDLIDYARFLRSDAGTGDSRWPTPRYASVDSAFYPSCVRTSTNGGRCRNFFGDDVEVDLDQEAIYTTAPYANQRAYLSANDLYGMVDSLVSIGDDASDPGVDRHIVAASISWGICETDLNGDDSTNAFYALVEDTLSYALATGVTVFAATGDDGGRCDGTHRGVSYPASSPQVVAVGGTEHDDGAVTATNASGWPDSGGGASTVFPRPDYQAAVTGAAMRTVPDLSALAGKPGFDIRTSSPSETSGGRIVTRTIQGTSLATPVSAATYALEVAAHGYSWGVGDILPGLYRQPSGFTDVDDACTEPTAADCPGWNGVDVAKAGYDVVTGLGTPRWSALVNPSLGGDPHLSVDEAFSAGRQVPVTVRVPDWQSYDRYRIDVDSSHACTLSNAQTTKPTSVTIDDFGIRGLADGVHELTLVAWDSTATPIVCHYADAFAFVDTQKPLPSARLSVQPGGKELLARWGASDVGGSGIASFTVRVSTGGHTVLSTRKSRAGSLGLDARPGRVYTLSVQATDRVGHSSSTTAQAADDKVLSFGRGWTRDRDRAAFGGSQASTARDGGRAVGRVVGSSVWVYVTTCPSCGRLTVSVSGHKPRTVDTYSAKAHHRVGVRVFRSRHTTSRQVVIRATGTHHRSSGGARVLLDALATQG